MTAECRSTGDILTRRPSLVQDGEISFAGEISQFGPLSVPAVRAALAQLSDAERITLRITSAGGNVDEAQRIYTLLRDQPKPITAILEQALSSALYVAMAAQEIVAVEGAQIMLHRPRIPLCETLTAADLRMRADLLDQAQDAILDAFVRRTGQPREVVADMMARETWLTAERAVELGFADRMQARPRTDDECPMLRCPRPSAGFSGTLHSSARSRLCQHKGEALT